jgi:hypothetical protein
MAIYRGPEMAMASVAGPEMPVTTIAPQPSRVRKEFPETWIWDESNDVGLVICCL